MFDYYTKVMPIYADTFMDRWKKEYVPRLQQMQNAILDFDFEHKSLPEIMIHMEDMLDMKSEAFRIHWIINWPSSRPLRTSPTPPSSRADDVADRQD